MVYFHSNTPLRYILLKCMYGRAYDRAYLKRLNVASRKLHVCLNDHFYPQGIANKYPDFKSDHALALLLMRGDMTRAEARQVVT